MTTHDTTKAAMPIHDISNAACILLVPPPTKSTMVNTEATIEINQNTAINVAI